ncbi:hypothetical protein GCM10022415_00400 [Knoellia locipacati]|uniref:ABC transporter substrate-binding protein n=1 Tax=Knoellia locipacati TaxID=882824 RepID=A0A512SVM3_9MICO|nr:TRAP transporter substrate-binding protein DctP [Knoellia locipacati]GEQ11993.1 hypothetical protein KLO01_00400 [Knoellia locipacati]
MSRLSIIAPTVLLASAAALAGCSGAGPSKAGGSTPPVMLTLGTDDTDDRLSAGVVAEFTRQVTALSDGAIVIKPRWRAAGPDQADWDQKVARMVRAGTLDLGMIPARAWDTEGVSTFRALHAPFLVDSDALVRAVVTDHVAGEMLAGLEPLGLTGLALVPESMRHPFSFGDPLLHPADLEGSTVRTPRSDVGYATFEAFGARPTDMGGPGKDFGASVADGTISAAESSYDAALHLPRPAVGTANVTLYPKVETLVANAGVLAGLSIEQREALKKAAVATRTWAATGMPTDAKAASDFCKAGGRTLLAPQAAVASWKAKASPVYVQLRKDAATATMIDTIGRLKQSVAVPEGDRPAACGSAVAQPSTSAPAAGANLIPDGTYRRDNTLASLVAAGIPEASAKEYVGALTFTLDGGVYTETPPPGATFPPCVGSYSSTATRLELRFETNCSGALAAAWVGTPEGLLLSDLEDATNPRQSTFVEAIFGSGRPFTKIG